METIGPVLHGTKYEGCIKSNCLQSAMLTSSFVEICAGDSSADTVADTMSTSCLLSSDSDSTVGGGLLDDAGVCKVNLSSAEGLPRHENVFDSTAKPARAQELLRPPGVFNTVAIDSEDHSHLRRSRKPPMLNANIRDVIMAAPLHVNFAEVQASVDRARALMQFRQEAEKMPSRMDFGFLPVGQYPTACFLTASHQMKAAGTSEAEQLEAAAAEQFALAQQFEQLGHWFKAKAGPASNEEERGNARGLPRKVPVQFDREQQGPLLSKAAQYFAAASHCAATASLLASSAESVNSENIQLDVVPPPCDSIDEDEALVGARAVAKKQGTGKTTSSSRRRRRRGRAEAPTAVLMPVGPVTRDEELGTTEELVPKHHEAPLEASEHHVSAEDFPSPTQCNVKAMMPSAACTPESHSVNERPTSHGKEFPAKMSEKASPTVCPSQAAEEDSLHEVKPEIVALSEIAMQASYQSEPVSTASARVADNCGAAVAIADLHEAQAAKQQETESNGVDTCGAAAAINDTGGRITNGHEAQASKKGASHEETDSKERLPEGLHPIMCSDREPGISRIEFKTSEVLSTQLEETKTSEMIEKATVRKQKRILKRHSGTPVDAEASVAQIVEEPDRVESTGRLQDERLGSVSSKREKSRKSPSAAERVAAELSQVCNEGNEGQCGRNSRHVPKRRSLAKGRLDPVEEVIMDDTPQGKRVLSMGLISLMLGLLGILITIVFFIGFVMSKLCLGFGAGATHSWSAASPYISVAPVRYVRDVFRSCDSERVCAHAADQSMLQKDSSRADEDAEGSPHFDQAIDHDMRQPVSTCTT